METTANISAAADLVSSVTGATVPVTARATHKIVFLYDNSDDDEGTVLQVAAPQHDLTMDKDDLESDAGSLDFVEDVQPAAAPVVEVLRTERVLLQHELPIPRAPDAVVTFYKRRGQQEDPLLRKERAAPAAEAEAQNEDALPPAPPTKRDRDVKVTSDGYHLTLDERDLVTDWESGLTRPIRRQPPAAEPAESAVSEDKESVANDDGDVEEDDDEEDDDAEDDEELDDLLLVATAEQLLRCCEDELKNCPPENPRDLAAFTNFVKVTKEAHTKLLADETTPMEFALLIKPLVGGIYGVLKRASRPPKAEPIVIDGVVMDM